MPHRHSSHPRSSSENSTSERADRPRTNARPFADRQQTRSPHPSLPRLIEQDALLQTNTQIVLMYGPFQAELLPEAGQGVASWLRDCVRKHGLPSLLRFDYRRKAQIFRRDQFAPWLEPLMEG
jgi:hypothetical protein